MSGRPLLWRASWRYLARHPLRFGLASLGIALGAALAIGIDVASVSVRRSFQQATGTVAGEATHEIVASVGGVPEATYTRLRTDPALAALVSAAPVVRATVSVVGRPGEAVELVGVDPFAERDVRPSFAWNGAVAGAALDALITRPGAAILDGGLARRLGLSPETKLDVRVGGQRRTLLAVSTTERDAAGAAVVDVATAQELLGQLGRLSRIDLRLRPGVNDVQAIRAVLPPGVTIQPAGARTGALLQMTRAFDLNLRALSLLGLLVGAFLVYNTITVAVAQRRPVLATLRTLGVTRRELGGVIIAEALLLGAIGAVVGVVLGVALGRGLVALVAQVVTDLYFVVTVRTADLPTAPLVRGFLLAWIVAALAAVPAAAGVMGSEPRAALSRSLVEERARARAGRLALGGAGLVAGAVAIFALSGKSLGAALAGLLALLLGVALTGPWAVLWLSRAGGHALGALAGLPGRMAARNTGAALSRTGVAVAALMVALSVSVGVELMVTSFRRAVSAWLAETLQADIYVTAPSLVAARNESRLPLDLPARVRALPGVDEVATNRTSTLDVAGGPALLVALDLGPRARQRTRLLSGDPTRLWDRLDAEDALIVSEPFATKRGVEVGHVLQLPTARGPRPFRVFGVYRDYGSDAGVLMMSARTYDRHFDDPAVTAVALFAKAGTDVEALLAATRALAKPDEEFVARSNRALRAASLEVFDRTFQVTAVLRLLALIVAALGVTGALMALQLERTRELGTLRALGFTRGQLGRLLTAETGFQGLMAGVLAVPVGVALAAVIVFVINERSFGWSMDLALAPGALWTAPVLGLLAGVIGGLYPAWRLSHTAPAEALREE